jgi:hypothetical protein
MATPTSIRGVFLGASAAALGVAIQVANGTLSEESFTYLNVAAGFGFAALACPRYPAQRLPLETWITGVLCAALAWQVGYLFVAPPGIYLHPDVAGLRLFLRGLGAAVVLSGGLLQPSRCGRGAFMAGLLAIHLLLGMWILRTSREPHIDVYYFQRDSCNAILHGTNPYAITFPNIYGDATPFYGPDATWHGRLKFGLIYPPLSLFLALPGYLVGDYRYSQLFAVEAAAALMAWSSREHRAVGSGPFPTHASRVLRSRAGLDRAIRGFAARRYGLLRPPRSPGASLRPGTSSVREAVSDIRLRSGALSRPERRLA